MTLLAETTRVQYSGDGSTVAFTVSFNFWDADDLEVILTDGNGDDTTWTRGTQYTVSGGSGSTGTVTVETSPTDYTPAADETLTIRSNIDDVQETSLPLGGPLPTASMEQQLDKIVRMGQQRNELLDRALRRPASDDTAISMVLPSAADRANKLLVFGSSGEAGVAAASDASSDSATPSGAGVSRLLADLFRDRGYNIDDFDGVSGDGSTDDYAAIQAAINVVEGLGGGRIYFNDAIYMLSDTLIVEESNVKLIGVGAGTMPNYNEWDTTPGVAGTLPASEFESAPHTIFRATSALTGGAVLHVRTDPDATSTYAKSHIIIEGIHLDCNQYAIYGLEVSGVKHCRFTNILVSKPETYGVYVHGISPADHSTYNKAVQFCEFDNIYVRADHDRSSGQNAYCYYFTGTPTSNVNYCNFKNLYAIHDDGHGLFLDNIDTCVFFHVNTFAFGSGKSIWFDGAPDQTTNATVFARYNTFFYVQMATGGLGGIRLRQATGGSLGDPNGNVIYGLSSGNGGVGAIVQCDDRVVFRYTEDEDERIWNAVTPTLSFRRTNSFSASAVLARIDAEGEGSDGAQTNMARIESIGFTSGEDQVRWDFYTASPLGASDTSQAVGTGSVTLASGESAITDYYVGSKIYQANDDVSVTAITAANPPVVTAAGHGRSDGDLITITGVSGMVEVNWGFVGRGDVDSDIKRLAQGGCIYKVANATTNTFELTNEDGSDINGSQWTAYTSGGTVHFIGTITAYNGSTKVATVDVTWDNSSGTVTYTMLHGLQRRFYVAGGIVVTASGQPTGTDKGPGTINAKGVYDDNSLLSCYVFDQALDGRMDDAKWDGKVPDLLETDARGEPTGQVFERTHEPMRRFRTSLGPKGIDLDDYANHWKTQRHLPAMPDERVFDPVQNMSHGEWIQRLVETVEVQAILIEKLNERLKVQEAKP